jgi:hypothetical protein
LMTWNLMHMARIPQGRRVHPRLRKPALRMGRRMPVRLPNPRLPVTDRTGTPSARLPAGSRHASSRRVTWTRCKDLGKEALRS